MKTAEEWMLKFGSCLIEGLDAKTLGLPAKFNRPAERISLLSKEEIQQIQLDAYNQAIEDADYPHPTTTQ